MDVFLILALLFGILKTIAGQSTLKCIECTHIFPNRSHVFPNSNNVYNLLQSKFNLACALHDPFNREELAWREGELRKRGIYIPTQISRPTETVCSAISMYNKCNFVLGNVGVMLPHYNNERLHLQMYVRNCETVDPQIEDTCYERNSQLGNQELLNFFEDRLSFLGSVKVFSFYGRQCYCRTNSCSPYVSGSQRTSGYAGGLLVVLIMALFL